MTQGFKVKLKVCSKETEAGDKEDRGDQMGQGSGGDRGFGGSGETRGEGGVLMTLD